VKFLIDGGAVFPEFPKSPIPLGGIALVAQNEDIVDFDCPLVVQPVQRGTIMFRMALISKLPIQPSAADKA
jgi:hypothetical protein